MLTRINDLYIMPEAFFLMFTKPTPERVVSGLALLDKEFNVIEGLLGEELADPNSYDPPAAGPFICGKKITLGDVALATSLFATLIFLPRFNKYDPFKGRPRLQTWWSAILQDHDLQAVKKEVETGLEIARQRLKAQDAKL